MFDATERTVPLQGAQRLLLAVLEEAIGTFQRYALARDQRGRTMFEQADAWFDSDDTGWVFAFESVCDALGVDPGHVRTGLRQWMDGQRVPFLEELPLEYAGRDTMAGCTPGRLLPPAAPGLEYDCPVPSRQSRGSGGQD